MTNQTKKKRIVLLTNPGKPRTIQVGRELLEWLKPKVQIADNNLEKEIDLSRLPEIDFIIVIGGDGTILSTIRALGANQVPVIGVNMGKLGFLAEFSLQQFQELFDRIISQYEPYNRRMMLNCRITGPGRADFVSPIVNELAITAGPPFRMIEVSVSIAEEHLACCAGDGLIVATPTGSTAYNLSAGGPILASSLHAAVITPLAAHSLSFRPVVVDMDKPIILRCRNAHSRHEPADIEKTESGRAVVVIDGQEHTPLKSEDRITITADPNQFLLVPNPRQNQWRLLNTKLNWGALPNYELPG
ncbi:MAG: NAD(+)/NADH kinase [Sedimentisphaerales bacterium]|nr:NAD(+)/NADH kinase [Sedimentisphaerales bacterium]